MAQNTTTEIFKIEIEADKAIADLAESQKKVNGLREKLMELKAKTGDNSIEIAKLTAELKNEQKALTDATKVAQANLNLRKEEIPTLMRLQSENIKLRKERDNLNLSTDAGKSRLIELNAKLDENNKFIKENSDKQKQQALNVGNYTESVVDAIEQTGGFNFQLLKLAKNPVVLILLAVVGTLKAMFDAFKKTKEGADLLGQASSALSGILSLIENILGKLAVSIVKAFQDPIQAVEDLGQAILDNLINRFVGMYEFIPKLGDALAKAFEGEWTEAGNIIKDATAKAVFGVENLTEKQRELKAELDKSIARAEALRQAELKLLEATTANTKAIAKYNQEAQLQRQIADDSTKSFKERSDAIVKAQAAEEAALLLTLDLEQKKLEIIELQIAQAIVAEQDIRQLRRQEADAIAAVTNAETQKLLKEQENAKIREEIARDEFERNLDYYIDNFDRFKTYNEKQINDEKKTSSERKALIDATRQLSDTAFTEQIAQIQTRTDAEINANDLLQETDTRRLIEKVRLLKLDEIEEGRLLEVLRERSAVLGDLAEIERDITIENAEQLREFRKSESIKELEAAKQTVFTKLEIERVRLQQEYQQEIEYAQKIGAETTGIAQRYARAQKEIDRAAFDAKLELASGFSANIATIFGEQTAIGKAAAIAETTINTYKAAQGAYSALAPVPVVGPALGAVAAAAAVASGLANVRKILAVDSGLPGGNASPSGIQGGTPSAPKPPTVNEGIVSRETLQTRQDELNVAPTLVIDDVTQAQNSQQIINNTSVI